MDLVKFVEEQSVEKKTTLLRSKAGDTVSVHYKIREETRSVYRCTKV